MASYVNSFFEERVDQLFDLAGIVEQIFSSAGVEYRIIGGLATYLYVEEQEPDAGRLTRDIDVAVKRADLEEIAVAARQFGLELRHAAGIDMLCRTGESSARRAVHLIFAGEKVRPDYLEPAPALGPHRTLRGLKLIPLADLVRMKLTSFRLKDQVHLKDLDEVELITPDIEAHLPDLLKERLAQVRERA